MEILKTRRDIPKQTKAYIVDGPTFYSALRSLRGNLYYSVYTTKSTPTDEENAVLVSLSHGEKAWLWKSTLNAGPVIYIATSADTLVFNADCNHMFYDNLSRSGAYYVYFGNTNISRQPRIDFSQIANAEQMFAGAYALEQIFVPRYATFPSSAVTTGMFADCTSLIGGAGTRYDSSHTDGTYARIDNPPTAPGYFTLAT